MTKKYPEKTIIKLLKENSELKASVKSIYSMMENVFVVIHGYSKDEAFLMIDASRTVHKNSEKKNLEKEIEKFKREIEGINK